MNIATVKRAVWGVIFITALGMSTYAFAGWGRGPGGCPGYGPQGGPGYGPENCPGYNGGNGQGIWSQLSEEERNQLTQARDKFIEQTKGLRDQLFAKRDALSDELAKDSPDVTTASKIQNEISELKKQLDQKRLEHLIEIKKINPKLGNGYARWKGGAGAGAGSGYGGGPCWRR